MIIDTLKNSNLYLLNDKFKKAFKFLSDTDLLTIEPGKYEIDGQEVFALVMEYGTKDISEGRWEAHKKYIDVQFVAQGSELFGYASMNNMKEETEYDTEKDVYFLEGNGNFIDLQEGMFGVFFPHDVHMPSISKDKSIKVKKVVVKVKA